QGGARRSTPPPPRSARAPQRRGAPPAPPRFRSWPAARPAGPPGAADRSTGEARPPAPSSVLLQEPDVVVVQQPEVWQPVLQHGDPLDPHPEGESLDLLGVIAVLANVLEHVGIDHPGPQDLDPGRPLAQ